MGAAFASGDRFVIGRWPVSPFGGVADVMRALADEAWRQLGAYQLRERRN